MELEVPNTRSTNGPDPACTLTPDDLLKLPDPHIVILATLGQDDLRRPAAMICQSRGLWLSARPSRHREIMAEALASPVHVREAA